tara:strand:+ start:234 stop:440 length:207 start_codon:yes stop_codon:yes gene_type:complete
MYKSNPDQRNQDKEEESTLSTLLRVGMVLKSVIEDKEGKITPPKGGFLIKVRKTIIDRCGETIFLDGR